jgi:hypothetical protein
VAIETGVFPGRFPGFFSAKTLEAEDSIPYTNANADAKGVGTVFAPYV